MRHWLRYNRLSVKIRLWLIPMGSQAVVLGESRFRVTWRRTKVTHRRGEIIGIERWTTTSTDPNITYGYTLWKAVDA